MNYAQTAHRANPAAMLGALAIPSLVGAVLVVGLAVKITVPPIIENPDVFDITPETPDDPPPVEPTDVPQEPSPTKQTPTYTPETNFDFDVTPGPTTLIDEFPLIDAGPTLPVEIPGTGGLGTSPLPALPDPIAAKPSNNPGRWIIDNDYRTPWIRRGMSGVAGFKLEIDRNGRVSDCQIIRSTGHMQLDEATCSLIERRARFDPAKDSNGNPTAGSYSSSVNWVLPD